MSFSFTVPAGPASEFTARAQSTLAALQTANEGNDYSLTQLSCGLADEGIVALQSVIDSGKLGPADTVSASLTGHYNTGDGSALSMLSVTINVQSLPTPAS